MTTTNSQVEYSGEPSAEIAPHHDVEVLLRVRLARTPAEAPDALAESIGRAVQEYLDESSVYAPLDDDSEDETEYQVVSVGYAVEPS